MQTTNLFYKNRLCSFVHLAAPICIDRQYVAAVCNVQVYTKICQIQCRKLESSKTTETLFNSQL